MKRTDWPFTSRRIAGVRPIKSHGLEIVWADGERSRVDLTPWLDNNPALAGLREQRMFESVEVGEEGFFISWDQERFAIDSIHLQLLQAEQEGVVYLGEGLKRWRARLGLTQDQAAKALGLSKRMVAYYESGQTLIPTTVALACKGWEELRKKGKAA